MPYQDEEELPIVGDPSREELARLMFIYGMPGHLANSLHSMSMPDDAGGEDDEGQSVMTYGGDTSGNDSAAQALDEQGYMGAGGSSSPLNVTPLRERVASLGKPPTKTEQIMGLLSDIAAGGLAGARTPQARTGLALHGRGVSPGLAATLGGFAGIQAGEANSRAREDRRRVLDNLDFGRQAALYNADIQRAKFEAQEGRLNAQAQATKAYHEALAQQAKIKGRELIMQMKYGEVKVVGNDVYRLFKDGRPPQKISESPDGEFAKKVKFLTEQAKAQGWTPEEYQDRVNHLTDPTYKSDKQKKAEEDAKQNTWAFKTARSTEATTAYTDGLYAQYRGDLKKIRKQIEDDSGAGTIPEFVSVTKAHGIIAALEQKENILTPPPKVTGPPTVSDLDRRDAKAQDDFERRIARDLFTKYKSAPLAIKRLSTEDLSSYVTRHKREPRLDQVAEHLKKLILTKAQSKGSGEGNPYDRLSQGGGGGGAASTTSPSTPSGSGSMPQPKAGHHYEFDLSLGKVVEVPDK